MAQPPLRDSPPTTVVVRPALLVDPDVAKLTEAVQREYVERYGGPDGSPMDPAGFAPPQGRFVVGYLDEAPDEPVAMGGWRWRPGLRRLGGRRLAEVKRMYVVPRARRRGAARVVLTALEDSARAAGADVLVLETGTAQPEAIRLYLTSGYELVDGFGYYADSPLSRCFGKRL